jgi:inhibitor of cysteine peptidase
VAVTLTEADEGREVSVGVGDSIVVVLEENPTTGYRWQIVRANGILELAGDSYEPASPMRVGSGGHRELRFRATAAGSAAIELRHLQQWDESSVTARFSVRVRVTT